MIQNIRNRFSKKSALAVGVFALALTISGAGSLAVLTDTATTTITASITSIDLTANNSKAASIDFGQVEPGSIGYAPVTLRNAGSGYLNLTAASTSNGSAVSNDSRVNVIVGIPVTSCNAVDAPFNNVTNDPIVQSSLFPEWVVGAAGTTGAHGDTLNLCLIYKVGISSGVGYGQTGFSTTVTFSATHP